MIIECRFLNLEFHTHFAYLIIIFYSPNDENNELVLLFVKMKNDVELTQELIQKIKFELRNQMSPRHVPNCIYKIEDIPYTNSGKKVELAVKEVLQNRPVKNKNSIRNPEALQYFAKFA